MVVNIPNAYKPQTLIVRNIDTYQGLQNHKNIMQNELSCSFIQSWSRGQMDITTHKCHKISTLYVHESLRYYSV